MAARWLVPVVPCGLPREPKKRRQKKEKQCPDLREKDGLLALKPEGSRVSEGSKWSAKGVCHGVSSELAVEAKPS